MDTDKLKTTRMEAARAGQSKYEGGPCKNCSGTVRYTVSGNCVACQIEDSSARKRELQSILNAARAAGAEE
jgi:hypothetical protein